MAQNVRLTMKLDVLFSWLSTAAFLTRFCVWLENVLENNILVGDLQVDVIAKESLFSGLAYINARGLVIVCTYDRLLTDLRCGISFTYLPLSRFLYVYPFAINILLLPLNKPYGSSHANETGQKLSKFGF